MNSTSIRRFLVAVAAVALALSTTTAVHAVEHPKDCCKIIRVDPEKGTAWLRNPGNGLLAQFRLGLADADRFKVGDRFNPETNVHNGAPLARKYSMVVPKLGARNAKIIRVRGHEVAVVVDESKTVYRFYTLKFGKVLSSLRPGEEILVDELGGWAIVEVAGYGEVKPTVWAFALD